MNLNAGARTGMSSVFTGVVVLITLLFLTPLLYHLPQSVLAAVIMMAVIGLINFKAIRHAWEAHKHDGIAAVVTFVATLAFAPHLDNGILVGAGLAVGLFLYRTMKPRVALLGRFPDGTLRDLRVHPTLPTDERIIVMRFDGQLYFANVSYFEDTILAAVADHPNAQYVLVVADGINQLDASGQEVLEHLIERLGANGITVVLSGMKRQVDPGAGPYPPDRAPRARRTSSPPRRWPWTPSTTACKESGYRPLRMPAPAAPQPA